ncbi:hypothetical protein RI129_006913 [Pyrocoelia pectoralis]|uniref:lysoplasmalogenase n=1 Tax=Pyrocoelia pectoralis TaxID=417401 RepID=A0AAN7VD01_9COLE
MTSMIKGVGPKLVPFFKTLAIYFVVFIPQDQPSVLATILKCLPSIGLIVFVILHTRSTGSDYSFSKNIITGLLFGCLGDACLVWPGFFEIGVFSFLIGHFMYIRALGFQPMCPLTGLIFYVLGILGVLFYWLNLRGILILGAPLYAGVIMTMVWRAAARIQTAENNWCRMCTCIGAISFAVSDFCVAYNQFIGKFPYDQLVIMTLYYTGQFGLTLSILDATIEESHKLTEGAVPSDATIEESHKLTERAVSCGEHVKKE